MLMKTRAELQSMIPGAGANPNASNPTVLAMTEALKALDAIKEEKDSCMAEGVEKAQNFNAVDDLMQAHRGVMTRDAAFEKNVSEFTAFFNKQTEKEDARKVQCGVIQ